MSRPEIEVSLDDRARLTMAILAASDWPEREQARETHAVHPYAKQTRQFLRGHRDHPAVTALEKAVDDGLPLADLFSAVLRHSWPELKPVELLPGGLIGASWTSSLVDFHRVTGIADFWREHASNWEEAQRDLVAIFRQTRVVSFLNRLRPQPVAGAVAVVPSIVYPMLQPVLATTAAHLYLVLPPAKAWGESPPWPFGEDPPWVVAQTCWQLAAHFLAAELARLDPSNQALLQHAAVTLCLEQEFDEAEAMAYLVRTKKEHQLPQLPVVAERLRAFLSDPHDSRDPAGRPLLSLFE